MVLVRSMMCLARHARAPLASVRRLTASTSTQRSADDKERRYTRKHEWVSLEGQVGIIGISNYAQEALGEVVFVQLPEPGAEVAAGEECGALESVKAASEIYAPVSGMGRKEDEDDEIAWADKNINKIKVTEKNSEVESSPALINESCMDRGWLFKVHLSKPEELQRLMDQVQYDQYLQEQEH